MITLIRGIPGSGKSTLAKKLLDPTNTRHYEADMFFTSADGKYNFDGMMLREAHAWCQECTFDALKRGYNVIVSNTFTQLKELETYFKIARDATCPIPNIILCQGNFGSIHAVPEQVVNNMRKRFEYDVNPLYKKYWFSFFSKELEIS